ncbi:hypothetical protein [Enterocloster lavalensis]|uniref:hypothetical protein n=1 Tax=Enterocloster lavalensis TaxID=460384 RepID=UPI000D19EF07|nr:hypothetical protein [Enterocloster lavalensis]PST29771.1 hypothetical protein C7256_27800 [Enterocloster lavalensis]
MKKKSISGQLKKKKTFQGQKNCLLKWGDAWYREQSKTIEHIYRALQENRIDDAFHRISRLRTITEQRFTALQNVVVIVSDPDRKLTDIYDTDEKEEPVNILPEKSPEEHEKGYSLDRKPNVDISRIKEIDVDEIIKCYNSGMSLTEISKYNDISLQKVRKILITAGVYSSETYDRIKELRADGKSDWEIMDRVDISKKALSSYTPYKKGLYNLSEESATINAMAIRRLRERKSD